VVRRLAALLLLLLLAGCAARRPAVAVLRDAEIHRDTVWQGRVVVDGQVKVFKGATLTLLPGTEVAFVRRDHDRDGLGDGTLIVEGGLRAVGTRQAPIRFRSAAADPQPGDWLEIRVDFARDVALRWCEISDSAHTLHAHFTRGVMEDCTIRGNIDGSRLGESTFAIRHCLIERNSGKGINFRNAAVTIEANIIRHNGAGIFLFESDRASHILGNNLYGNAFNFRLGDFYQSDVELGANWWGTVDPAAAADTIYDRRQDPTIGSVRFTAAPAWIIDAGPRDALALREAWRLATGGFVDASAVADGSELFVGGWDGRLRRLATDGRLLWERDLGEVVDAAVAVDAGQVYAQTWGRAVYALDRRDGALRWRFDFPASPADDHRQGGLARSGGLLLVPAWNGTLYALDPGTGRLLWQYAAGEALRATPVVDGDRLYLAGAGGALTALALDGRLLWQRQLGSPLLAHPAATPDGPVAVTKEGTLVALDRQGEERWRQATDEPCFYGAPLYADGALYLGTAGGSLWKLEAADGAVVWRQEAPGPLYGTPLLAGGRLFAGDNDGLFYVVGADSGSLLATFRSGGAIQGTPALVAGRLLLGSRDRHLYALDLIELATAP
jgi:outer membrane protein assembly factor BamB